MITDSEMVSAMVEHGISVRAVRLPGGDEWVAERPGNPPTRLMRGTRGTPNEAVEAALATVTSERQTRAAADAVRLLAVLARGRAFQRMRAVQTTDAQGDPVTLELWDMHRTADNVRIVTGESSLAAAIVKAEQVLNGT